MAGTLAADNDQRGIFLVLDQCFRCLAGIGGISTGQALVTGDKQNELFAVLMLSQQGMRKIISRGSSNLLYHLHDLFCIRLIGKCCLFGMTETRGRHHVHGTGYLLGTLYALNAMADVL